MVNNTITIPDIIQHKCVSVLFSWHIFLVYTIVHIVQRYFDGFFYGLNLAKYIQQLIIRVRKAREKKRIKSCYVYCNYIYIIYTHSVANLGYIWNHMDHNFCLYDTLT